MSLVLSTTPKVLGTHMLISTPTVANWIVILCQAIESVWVLPTLVKRLAKIQVKKLVPMQLPRRRISWNMSMLTTIMMS